MPDHFDGMRDGDVLDADGLHPRTDEDRVIAVDVADAVVMLQMLTSRAFARG